MTHTPPRLPAELLDRYFTGHCTPDEVVRVRAALAQNPDLAAVQREIDGPSVDVDAGWARFAASGWADTTVTREPSAAPGTTGRSVGVKETGGQRHVASFTSGTRVRYLVFTAVAVAMIVGGVYSFRVPSHQRPQAVRTYQTADGERATLHLADGSTVTLAPHTTLRVPLEFGDGTRLISLVGEARFDVAAQRHAPFVVRTGDVTTRVLGTVFAVRRDTNDHVTQVAVLSGRVAVQGGRQSAVLDAGMIGRATDSTAAVVLATEPGTYTDWPHGRVVFRSVPIPAMLTTLGHWAGYEFRLADSGLVDQHVTATFDVNDTQDMLPLLEHLLGVELKVEGNIVTLHRRMTTGGSQKSRTRQRDLNSISTTTEVGR